MGFVLKLAVVFCIVQMSVCEQAYQQKALNLHNQYRAKHKSPAMILDDKLNDIAVRCAKYYAKKKDIDHSCPYKTDVGENLFAGMGNLGDGTLCAKMATNRWYNEVKDYDYNKPGDSPGTGHFTQLVWKKSQKLGIGHANINGYTFVVGVYSLFTECLETLNFVVHHKKSFYDFLRNIFNK